MKEQRTSGRARDRTRVLVIEDDVALRWALKLLLEHDNHDVAVARDGDEAMALLDEFTPDIVVTDWRVPGLSGLQMCAEMRRRQATLPIVVVSGADEAFETAAPVNARLRKPVDVERLRQVIAHELDASPAIDDPDSPSRLRGRRHQRRP